MLRTTSARPVAVARIGIGIAAALRAAMAWGQVSLFTDEVVRMPVVSWLPDPGSVTSRLIVGVWLLSALGLAFGRRVGLTGTLAGLSVMAFLLLDSQTYANHLYLLALLLVLLAVSDSGAALSHRPDAQGVVAWPVQLIKAQIVLVYGFSAITKLNDAFLSGEVLAGVLRDGLVTVPPDLLRPALMGPLAIATIVAELAVAFFIWRPRTFSLAILLGTGLHLSIVLLMGPTSDLIVFGLMMLSTYVLFVPTEPIAVGQSPSTAGMRRRDVLQVVTSHDSMDSTVQSPETDAVAIAERVIPDLWVAGLWRLPGIGSLWKRRHA